MRVSGRVIAVCALFGLAGMVLASVGATVRTVQFWLMIAIISAIHFVGVMG